MRALGSMASFLLLAACGGSGNEAGYPPPAPVEAEPQPVADAPPKGALWRDEVDVVLQGGLGRFLQHVELEPALSEGKFRGFRIVALRPAEAWTGVDLVPGDVVTGVNGMPIERETEAWAAFESLRKSDALRVQFLRSGEPKELVYRIVERPTLKSQAKTSRPDAG